MASIKTIHGEYTITQLFGQNPSMYARFGMKGHNGVDFVGMARNYALAAGEYHSSGFDSDGYGYWVKIRDDHGNVWTYAHFNAPVVARGRIELFDDLGPMGTTGFSTGVHCHVGVKPPNPNQSNGYLGSIDPLPLINQNINEYMSQLDDLLRGQQEIKGHLQVIEDKVQNLIDMATNANDDERWKVQGHRLLEVQEDVKKIKKAVTK